MGSAALLALRAWRCSQGAPWAPQAGAAGGARGAGLLPLPAGERLMEAAGRPAGTALPRTERGQIEARVYELQGHRPERTGGLGLALAPETPAETPAEAPAEALALGRAEGWAAGGRQARQDPLVRVLDPHRAWEVGSHRQGDQALSIPSPCPQPGLRAASPGPQPATLQALPPPCRPQVCPGVPTGRCGAGKAPACPMPTAGRPAASSSVSGALCTHRGLRPEGSPRTPVCDRGP